MTVTAEEFVDAVKQTEEARKRLSKAKPSDITEIESADKQGMRAGQIIEAYFREDFERRFHRPFPQKPRE